MFFTESYNEHFSFPELFSQLDSPPPIDSYSTMSSTLLQEEYPLSVDFVGLPEICTSYISNQPVKILFD